MQPLPKMVLPNVVFFASGSPETQIFWSRENAAYDLASSMAGGAVVRGPFRYPLWPAGITGSISHSDGFIAIATDGYARAVGVDIEKKIERKIASDIGELIAHSGEYDLLFNRLQTQDFELVTTVIFSVKETAFKILFPLNHEFLDFSDGEIVDATKSDVTLLVRNWRLRIFWQRVRLGSDDFVLSRGALR